MAIVPTLKIFLTLNPDSLSIKSLEAVKTNESAPEQTIRDITSKQKMDDEVPEAEVGVRGLTTDETELNDKSNLNFRRLMKQSKEFVD